MSLRQSSPARWPWLSLYNLKPSISIRINEINPPLLRHRCHSLTNIDIIDKIERVFILIRRS